MSVMTPPTEVMSYVSDSGPITISPESVSRESDDIAALQREVEVRLSRFYKLVDYLRAVGREDWIPVGALQLPNVAAKKPGPPVSSGGTWSTELIKVLEKHPNGIALVDALEIMKDGPLADRVRQNRNGVYNASARLEKEGRVVKHNGRVFLSGDLDDFKRRVELGEVEDAAGRSGVKTSADALVEFISSQPQGVEAGDVVKEMKSRGISPGIVYNNLSKIVAKGRVQRVGKIYLPLNSEAPARSPESASEVTDGEGPTSPSNTGSGNE